LVPRTGFEPVISP